VVSKAAFELTARRGPRTQRIAAGAGYVVTELAKEALYYAGAFGATVLTDAVSSSEALVFLAGTNLGAAAYEYGLARVTRRMLRRPRCASLDTDWVPREYLADCYLPANLEELERWRTRDPAAHDWRPFVRYTLECEGLRAPTDEDVTRREELTRSKITRLLQVDPRRPVPLDQRYATVISAYLAGDKRFPSPNVDERDLRRRSGVRVTSGHGH
jgi:hypothetical protein